LQKRTKKLFRGCRGLPGGSRAKVFASFFKKKRFLQVEALHNVNALYGTPIYNAPAPQAAPWHRTQRATSPQPGSPLYPRHRRRHGRLLVSTFYSFIRRCLAALVGCIR
jgi:hypothetical protein